MSGTNADPLDPADSVDEWRVGSGESGRPGAPSARGGGEWSRGEASARCARVGDELSAWREELDERVRRLEQRLTEPADGP